MNGKKCTWPLKSRRISSHYVLVSLVGKWIWKKCRHYTTCSRCWGFFRGPIDQMIFIRTADAVKLTGVECLFNFGKFPESVSLNSWVDDVKVKSQLSRLTGVGGILRIRPHLIDKIQYTDENRLVTDVSARVEPTLSSEIHKEHLGRDLAVHDLDGWNWVIRIFLFT